MPRKPGRLPAGRWPARPGARGSARAAIRRNLSVMRRSVVDYVYGDELGRYEGRVKRGKELDEMAAEYSEFQVYVVEVCQSCGWNHLASSYVLGTGQEPARRGRRTRAGQ